MRLSMEATLDYYGVQYRVGRREQMVSCPAHEDATPSMSLNLDKGVALCHSCGLKGTALNIIQEVEGLDVAAIGDFATSAGIESSDAHGGGGTVRSGGISGRRVSGLKGNRPGNKRWVWSGRSN